ncbi:uncharacterized protein LOC106866892 isoform X2 [Brachypodium distachyon]|uniref:uncharacterized protein LOC106866892 isoform X2 n=1 Tax=Brachypodium distachyon TaxID=15368 RepID=UPI000D0D528D|nr:uncharacterized protein LOC106866892 isoform X2 [Brachypodium distachyon]|eukprot:XP_024318899.1 uncharacterized protein LOC106866892 isoform X2 [Brachypodium distachyon]
MKIVVWNCRGLGNRPAIRGLLELQKKEGPDILFLSETKLDKRRMEKFRNMLGLQGMLVRDCEGRSGGVALFWRRGVDVSLRWMGRGHIGVEVLEQDGFKWRLTGLYGSPRTEEKKLTLRLLRTLHQQADLPWVCLGDFNEILFAHEKQGGAPRAQSCLDNFRDVLVFCGLKDLGFEGDVFTWRNNNHRVDGYIRERLDHVVANMSWCDRCADYRVRNIDPEHSDHRPIALTINEGSRRSGRSFGQQVIRFEARWLLEEDCEAVVQNAWDMAGLRGQVSASERLCVVSKDLHDWIRNVLGDLQKRIKELKDELEACRREDISARSGQREQVLRFKLERLEDQHDLVWRQRAHVHWLEKGMD